jgi:hypothetical protein
MQVIPVQWSSVPEWMRKAATAVNDLIKRTQYAGTVAKLPTGSQGMRGIVTDATVTTFASVVVGGGANIVPVFHDGTSWRIG